MKYLIFSFFFNALNFKLKPFSQIFSNILNSINSKINLFNLLKINLLKHKIINIAINHARKVILTLILITAFISIGIKWVIIDDDFMKIIPDDIPSKISWDQVTKEFGIVDLMFIAFGNKKENILNNNSLSALWDITESLENIPYIDEVISLSNINKIEYIDDFLEVIQLHNTKQLNKTEINLIID